MCCNQQLPLTEIHKQVVGGSPQNHIRFQSNPSLGLYLHQDVYVTMYGCLFPPTS